MRLIALAVCSLGVALAVDALLDGHARRLIRAVKLLRHERRRATARRRHAEHLVLMTARYIEIGRLDLAASCQRELSTW